MTLFKEVTINFRTKTLGIFDVVTPVLEDGEIFNSGLLKDHINQMIASGRRSFSIDLSPLDYIYSDTINVLMVLNKRVLEISGRLTLLAPQPEVVGILQKAGIHNIMRVFDSEADLMRTSDEIMSMTPGYKVTELQNVAEALDEPQSEFDSLRSEIGSVFGDESESAAPPQPKQTPPRRPAPQQPPKTPQQSFDLYPMGGGTQPSPPSQQPPMPSKAPAYPPPVQGAAPSAPPTTPPVPPKASAPPSVSAGYEQGRGFSDDGDKSYTPSETRRFAQAPVSSTPMPEPVSDFDDLEGKPKKSRKQKDDFDTDSFEEEFEGKKKGFPVLALVAVLVLAGLGAGGYFLFFKNAAGTGETSIAESRQPKAIPTVSSTPSDSASKAEEDEKVSEKEEDKSDKEVAKATPKPKAKPVSKPKPAPKPAPKKVTRAAPKSAPAKPAPSKNQIVINSTPAGADVLVDGKKKGVTPYTWSSPFYGQVKVVVSKDGYESETKTITYEGGAISESFALRKAAPAPAKTAASTPKPSAPPPAEEKKPEPKPAAPAPAPAAAAPAPAPAPKPAAPAPPPPPALDASIYIASLPAKADVYIGGRRVGRTNDTEIKVPVGTHQVKFVKDGVEKTETMTFSPGKNPTRFVKLK